MSVTRGRCSRCDYVRRTCTDGTMAVHAPRVGRVKGEGKCPGSKRPPVAGLVPAPVTKAGRPSGPTAPCPVCLVPARMRQDGTLRAHGWSTLDRERRCAGSGAMPVVRPAGPR
jgi:hypothetical protein